MKPEPYSDVLGTPTPSKKSLEIFSTLIVDAINQVNKRFKVTHHRVPDEPGCIIYLSLLFYPPDRWEQKFTHLKKVALPYSKTPAIFWAAIAAGFYSPKIGEAYKKLNPSFDTEKYLTKTTTGPATQRASPRPTPTPSIDATLKKVIPGVSKPRALTVTEYILRHAPSKSYERTYSKTLARCWNKRSSKGKKVYPYGQAYIARLTGLNLRTIELHWSWLRKRGIFNKARNENPELHHCALWYVCTSMKQTSYFRDPENRHPKKKRHN